MDSENKESKYAKYQESMTRSKAKKIRSLNCFPKIQELLVVGAKVPDIAQQIHAEGEMLEYALPTITAYLYNFIESEKEVFALRYPTVMMNKIQKSLKEQDYVDPLDTYQFLTAIQVERLMINFKKELKDGRTTKDTDSQVKLLNTILKNNASIETDRTLRYVGRKLGDNNENSLPERLKAIRQQVTGKYGHRVNETLSDPESRRRLLNVLELMHSKSENEEAKKIMRDKLDRLKSLDIVLGAPKGNVQPMPDEDMDEEETLDVEV